MKLTVKRSLKGILLLLSLVVVLIGGRLALGILLKPAPHVLSPEDQALRARALELHYDTIVVDGHNDVLTWMADLEKRSCLACSRHWNGTWRFSLSPKNRLLQRSPDRLYRALWG